MRLKKWHEVFAWSVAALLFARFSAANELVGADPPFNGKININAKDSIPDWPESTQAPKGAPNIVVILLDDIGFADSSTFGGIAQTPTLTQLAARGLRYNNFNTTAMCSPTRAALLSGRNHHHVGFGNVTDRAGGYPGYNSVWKKSTVSLPEVLRRSGYRTAAFGKWHNTPEWEISPLGPFDRWPTGLGFESFYGFMGGLDNQWEPASLYRNTTAVEPPATPQQGYHLTSDITNEAIRWLQLHASLAPEKPYFLYFATGAVHGPHHAPKAWIEQYRGRFVQGWDKLREEVFARQKQLGVVPANATLTPRPAVIPAWDALSDDQQRLYARQMEVYAGFVAHTDYEVGRLLQAVQQRAGGDNTLILYIVGDNGAEAELLDGVTSGSRSVEDQLKQVDELGSPVVPMNIYSAGWAWLGNTPFQWWKKIASHFGGVRVPLIISWPARIKDPGALRPQFTHVTDVAATVYEVTGIRLPALIDGVKQQPLDGVSFAQTFDQPNTASRHRTQYFEAFGNRAIYHDGWVAAARHGTPLDLDDQTNEDYTQDRWELYHVEADFSQAHDLAAQYPGKLKKLQQLFDAEARNNDVYPLDAADSQGKPSLTEHKREFVYYPGMPRLSEAVMPPLRGKSYRITAQAVIPDAGAQGVILSYGERESGFALYVRGDRLVYENAVPGRPHELIASNIPVPHGTVVLAYEFAQDSVSQSRWGETPGSGTGRLSINGQVVGQAKVSGVGMGYSSALGIGRAFGSPVSDALQPPFAFTGTLETVKVNLE